MLSASLKILKALLTLSGVLFILFIGVRVYLSQRGPALELWHKYAPKEMSAEEIDGADWEQYLAAEENVFRAVRENVTDQLTTDERTSFNRYFENSPIYPGHFARNWNRSYVLEPEDAAHPAGAVVLLHGLTDFPYSLRHVALRYQEHGFVVVAIRLPAHGTTPAALTKIHWPDWVAAARLAIREARRRSPAPSPLHIVGFSNGGTIALKMRSKRSRIKVRLKLTGSFSFRPWWASRVRAFRWPRRSAGHPARLCKSSVAQRCAGVQPV